MIHYLWIVFGISAVGLVHLVMLALSQSGTHKGGRNEDYDGGPRPKPPQGSGGQRCHAGHDGCSCDCNMCCIPGLYIQYLSTAREIEERHPEKRWITNEEIRRSVEEADRKIMALDEAAGSWQPPYTL